MPCSLSDVPEPAISRIIKYARSRLIPGTNQHALVCRSWRSASTSCTHDEQLKLHMDAGNLSSVELAACCAWLQRHGSCVVGLTVEGLRSNWSKMQQLLLKPTTNPTFVSSQLTHLELQDTNLLSLVPYLQQLPALEHLGTSVCCRTWSEPWMLLDNADHTHDIPNLGQLCPRLVSLSLYVKPLEREMWLLSEQVDPLMLQLPPVGVTKLLFDAGWFSISGAYFTHLTALVDLTLDNTMLADPGPLAAMTRLQHLRLSQEGHDYDPLLPLASKLRELSATPSAVFFKLPSAVVCQLTALTALYLEEPVLEQEEDDEQQQQQQGNPLLSLPFLRHLSLSFPWGAGQSQGWMLRGLSNISSLRSLMLSSEDVVGAELVGVVGQVTQVTCLWTTKLFWYTKDRTDPVLCASVSCALHQLTGLQQLALDVDWLMADNTVLANLQQLTLLLVSAATSVGVGTPTPVQQLVQPLQGRCSPKLQRVVLLLEDTLPDAEHEGCQPRCQGCV